MKKKILFITTGGTIASGGENGLSPEKSGNAILSALNLACDYEILDLYAIDSTDVSPKHFRMLYNAVTENLPKYDGIVVLHGTDTMAYTAAVLDFTIDSEKPVILTGSMLPFGAENGDAEKNVAFAAECASGRSGVWLAFANRIIRGADIAKVNAHEKDAFRSYSGFVPEEKYQFPEENREFPTIIKLSPFSKAEDFIVSSRGAVIETYGAGGLPDNDKILSAVKALADKMPVIVTTGCLGGADLSLYAVGRRALECGAVEGRMSTECAAVLLWLRDF